MVSTKHPSDRQERLTIKKIRYEKQKKAASPEAAAHQSEQRANQVRLRRIREELKDKETQDALRSHSE